MPSFYLKWHPLIKLASQSLGLFVIANLALGAVYTIRDGGHDEQDAGALQYANEQLRQAYPERTLQQIEDLLTETWSRPFECDAELGFRERPSQGQYVNVSDSGFRWNANEPLWPPAEEAYNIFVFGGSTVFGYGVADDETIASHLREILRETTDSPIEIYNFGAGNYFSDLDRKRLSLLIEEGYVPNLALFIHGSNEFTLEPLFDVDDDNCEIDTDEGVHWMPIIRLAETIRNIAIPPTRSTNRVPSSSLEENARFVMERWLANVDDIRQIAHQNEFSVLFVWQPSPNYQYDLQYHLFSERASSEDKRLYEMMATQQEQWSGRDDFLYLANLQTDFQQPLYVDRLHYNSFFSEAIANEIANYLLDNEYLANLPQ